MSILIIVELIMMVFAGVGKLFKWMVPKKYQIEKANESLQTCPRSVYLLTIVLFSIVSIVPISIAGPWGALGWFGGLAFILIRAEITRRKRAKVA